MLQDSIQGAEAVLAHYLTVCGGMCFTPCALPLHWEVCTAWCSTQTEGLSRTPERKVQSQDDCDLKLIFKFFIPRAKILEEEKLMWTNTIL